MAAIFSYFDNWREADLVCQKCGWKGVVDPGQINPFRELFDFACPKCAATLAIVSYPTEAEIKEHWHALSEEDRRHYEQRFELDEQFDADHLASPAQLPDLKDDPLVLVWDFEKGPGGDYAGRSFTAIKHRDRIIWRERAYFECVGRFAQVVDVLQKKYGGRLKDLTPTDRSLGYLGGDDLGAWKKLAAVRDRMSPQSVDPEVRLHALVGAGDSAAINFLRYRQEIGVHCLQSEDQLPAIDGESLVFGCTLAEDPPRVRVRCRMDGSGRETLHCDWDEQSGDGFLHLSVFHEDREIWKEAAPQNHPGRMGPDGEDSLAERYSEVADVLKRRYGSRAKDLVMTYASAPYVGFHRGGLLEEVRARSFPAAAASAANSELKKAIRRAMKHGAQD